MGFAQPQDGVQDLVQATAGMAVKDDQWELLHEEKADDLVGVEQLEGEGELVESSSAEEEEEVQPDTQQEAEEAAAILQQKQAEEEEQAAAAWLGSAQAIFEDMKQAIVRKLWHDPNAHYFKEPVDTVAFPHYARIIHRPMDLGTILTKLRMGEYTTPLDMCEDVRQVWRNCMLYNPPNCHCYNSGENLSAIWEREWRMGRFEARWAELLECKPESLQQPVLQRPCLRNITIVADAPANSLTTPNSRAPTPVTLAQARDAVTNELSHNRYMPQLEEHGGPRTPEVWAAVEVMTAYQLERALNSGMHLLEAACQRGKLQDAAAMLRHMLGLQH